jgi:ATP-binding cassette subfamily B multidrug efflux pump
MSVFGKYIKKYWKMFSVAFLFLTLEALADLMQPTIMAKIIDVGVANSKMDYVLQMGGIMLLVTAVGAVGACGRNIVASQVSQRFGAELRGDLFRKIQTLSFESIDKFDRASLVTRLTNDVTQVQQFTNGMMRLFGKAPLLCIGSLIMAARLNPSLSTVLLVVVPIVGVLIAVNMKIGFPMFMKVQQALDKVNGVMREYLSGVRVVKAFNRFDYEVDKFNGINDEYQLRAIRAMRRMSIFNPAITLTVNIGIVAVVWLGGIKVDNGSMPVGEVIAFVNYMTQILFSLMTISMVFNMFVRAKASSGRIAEVFLQENSMTWDDNEGGKTNVRGRVDFENVTFAYEGTNSQPVIRNLSLTCLPGETVGIIGSTGSGKSSLVNLIPRFYDAVSGSVKVDGEDIRSIDPKKIRDKIAIVPQKTVLFTGSVTENIRMGKEDASMEEIELASRMAEAHGFISEFPEGYDTVLGQKGVNFSGGQKQRVSIARALVRKPDILILDDCTSAVDMTTEARIKEALKKYAKGLTCIIIAQRITSVMDADKIAVLDNGQLVGVGKHDELLRTCQVYKEIFQSQIGKEVM